MFGFPFITSLVVVVAGVVAMSVLINKGLAKRTNGKTDDNVKPDTIQANTKA